jgi:hypothetical protein
MAIALFVCIDLGLWALSSLPIHRLDPAFALFGRWWALVILFIIISGQSLRLRAITATIALLLSSIGIALTIKIYAAGALLGTMDLWSDIARQTFAAIAIAIIFYCVLEAVFYGARRLSMRWLRRAILVAVIILVGFSIPQMLHRTFKNLYAAKANPKPKLLLMTSLPLPYGASTGSISAIAAGAARPAPALIYLAQNHDVSITDVLTAQAFSKAPTLLLAHSRALSPQENVALDGWVRAGGHAVILADTQLEWEPMFALGDPRNPAVATLLSPVLNHWGLDLDENGQWVSRTQDCKTAKNLAYCRIGAGQVTLHNDADFIDAKRWAGPGPNGGNAAGWRDSNMLMLTQMTDATSSRAHRAIFVPVWMNK